MTEQQQFQPGDRVKVTMELTLGDPESAFIHVNRGTVYPSTVQWWSDELDHIDVELIERPEPPREPGLYLCTYDDTPCAMRWDGTNWRWPGVGERVVVFQNEVTVLGTVTLDEGVEL